MRIFTVLGVLFYSSVIILAGIVLIVFALNLLQPQDINNLFIYTQSSSNSRIIIGLFGLLLILISLSFAQLILGRLQREKTIAFNNPEGQVTISLSAIEDLIRRIARQIPEIKDLRCDVRASKKGMIQITARTTLWSDANIPEVTEKTQSLIKSKVQDMLGVEEVVVCSVHISKIMHREEARRKKGEKDYSSDDTFRGSIEYSSKNERR